MANMIAIDAAGGLDDYGSRIVCEIVSPSRSAYDVERASDSIPVVSGIMRRRLLMATVVLLMTVSGSFRQPKSLFTLPFEA